MGDEKKLGARGGKARAANLTKAQLSEIGKKGAAVRWGGDLPVAEYNGVLNIGALSLPCAVLSDGSRVLTETEFMKAMEMYRSGALSVRRERGAREPLYLAFKNLKPFVDKHLASVHTQSMPFRTPRGNTAHGIRAEIIVNICDVWLDARDAGVLGTRQIQIAANAQILKGALAKYGVKKLVDEVTGYQEAADQDEIAKFLSVWVEKELQDYVNTFPRSFFEQLCRLKGVPFPKQDMRLPQYFGRIVNDLVYARLAPGVLPEVQSVNPVIGPKGRRKGKHHQFMTKKAGHPKLLNLVGRIEGIAYSFPDGEYEAFKKEVDRRIPNYGALPLFAAGDIPALVAAGNARIAARRVPTSSAPLALPAGETPSEQ